MQVDGYSVRLFEGDVSARWLNRLQKDPLIAVDTEYLTRADGDFTPSGIKIATIQLFSFSTGILIVRILPGVTPKNILKLLEDGSVNKVFHQGTTDLAAMLYHWQFSPQKVWDTKVGAKILFKDKSIPNSLADLTYRFLGMTLEKESRRSDWFKPTLTKKQVKYAARDVIYLLPIFLEITMRLGTSESYHLFSQYCRALSAIALSKAMGFEEVYGRALHEY